MIECRGYEDFLFPTGLLDMACTGLEEMGKRYEIIGSAGEVVYDEPYVEGITFRPYQERLIHTFLEHCRGVIKAPTATGKSVIIQGIVSAFSQETILLLVHTKDLVRQLYDDLNNGQFGEIGLWTGTKKFLKRITVSTIQSYIKIAEDNVGTWDVVLIDEGHHVSTLTGMYARALMYSAAPVKGAFTATMPYLPEAKMALEAYVGPMIGEYTIEEANADGYLAEPIIKIVDVPGMPYALLEQQDDEGDVLSVYQIIYENGIVRNVNRNLRILQELDHHYKKGESILIIVTKIDHGHELYNMITDHFSHIKAEFVHGAVKKRKAILDRLRKKELRCVIATKVFNEGVNIKSLNVVINAAGGKSEIDTLQKVGRGLRKDKGKQQATIIDFKDTCHPILIAQFNKRRSMYKANGWLDS